MATETLYLLLRFGFLALLWLLIGLCVLVIKSDLRREGQKAHAQVSSAKAAFWRRGRGQEAAAVQGSQYLPHGASPAWAGESRSGMNPANMGAKSRIPGGFNRAGSSQAGSGQAAFAQSAKQAVKVMNGASAASRGVRGVASASIPAAAQVAVPAAQVSGSALAQAGGVAGDLPARKSVEKLSGKLSSRLSAKVMPPQQNRYEQLDPLSADRGQGSGPARENAPGAGLYAEAANPLRLSAPGMVSRMLVLDGVHKGKIIPLVPAGLLIGRSQECDFQLQDNFASGKHARIFFQNGSWQIQDLHSTNGTFVNGDKIEVSYPLEMGTQIRIGQTTMELS